MLKHLHEIRLTWVHRVAGCLLVGEIHLNLTDSRPPLWKKTSGQWLVSPSASVRGWVLGCVLAYSQRLHSGTQAHRLCRVSLGLRSPWPELGLLWHSQLPAGPGCRWGGGAWVFTVVYAYVGCCWCFFAVFFYFLSKCWSRFAVFVSVNFLTSFTFLLIFSFLPFNLFCCGCNNPKLKKNPHKVLIKYDYRVDHYSRCLNAALVKVNLFGMFWP